MPDFGDQPVDFGDGPLSGQGAQGEGAASASLSYRTFTAPFDAGTLSLADDRFPVCLQPGETGTGIEWVVPGQGAALGSGTATATLLPRFGGDMPSGWDALTASVDTINAGADLRLRFDLPVSADPLPPRLYALFASLTQGGRTADTGIVLLSVQGAAG